jgi:hypothetical protein
MIILDATTKSLQIKLGAAKTTNDLPFSTSYIDTTGSSTTPGEQDGTSNGTTAVTVVGSPASATQRLVKSINIQNADTVASTVTVIYNNNSTLRNVFIATLAVGDQLIYEDGHGWSCLDSNGNLKTTGGGSVDNTAWTAYTPTIAVGSGSLTSATATGLYKTIGKSVVWQAQVNITTNGTAAGYIAVSLPFTAAANMALAAAELTTGVAMCGYIYTTANASYAFIRTPAAGYPGANGYVLVISGVSEST